MSMQEHKGKGLSRSLERVNLLKYYDINDMKMHRSTCLFISMEGHRRKE
jgi:hypothetical protein